MKVTLGNAIYSIMNYPNPADFIYALILLVLVGMSLMRRNIPGQHKLNFAAAWLAIIVALAYGYQWYKG